MAGPLTLYAQKREALTRRLLETTLLKHAGNRTQAARALAIAPRYLRYLLRRYGIH